MNKKLNIQRFSSGSSYTPWAIIKVVFEDFDTTHPNQRPESISLECLREDIGLTVPATISASDHNIAFTPTNTNIWGEQMPTEWVTSVKMGDENSLVDNSWGTWQMNLQNLSEVENYKSSIETSGSEISDDNNYYVYYTVYYKDFALTVSSSSEPCETEPTTNLPNGITYNNGVYTISHDGSVGGAAELTINPTETNIAKLKINLADRQYEETVDVYLNDNALKTGLSSWGTEEIFLSKISPEDRIKIVYNRSKLDYTASLSISISLERIIPNTGAVLIKQNDKWNKVVALQKYSIPLKQSNFSGPIGWSLNYESDHPRGDTLYYNFIKPPKPTTPLLVKMNISHDSYFTNFKAAKIKFFGTDSEETEIISNTLTSEQTININTDSFPSNNWGVAGSLSIGGDFAFSNGDKTPRVVVNVELYGNVEDTVEVIDYIDFTQSYVTNNTVWTTSDGSYSSDYNFNYGWTRSSLSDDLYTDIINGSNIAYMEITLDFKTSE